MSKVSPTLEKESFSDLLESTLLDRKSFDGKVVKGVIVAIRSDMAVIDVGLKSEGRVFLKDLSARGLAEEPRIGDTVDVFVERMEDKNGEAVLSIEKARREAAWGELEKAHPFFVVLRYYQAFPSLVAQHAILSQTMN